MTEGEEVRIGTAERDEAERLLGEHLQAGRISQGEYETRAQAVRDSWTRNELNVLFADLPEPKPTRQPELWEQPDFTHQAVVDPRVSDPSPTAHNLPARLAPSSEAAGQGWKLAVILAIVIVALLATGLLARSWWIIFPMIFFFRYAFTGFGPRRRRRGPRG